MVTLTVNQDGHQVLIAALDLYQRVAMGQWRDIPAVAAGAIDPDQAGPWTQAADDLMAIRCRYAADPALKYPAASLSIRATHETARIACDLWHTLGGGMRSRAGDRLTDVSVTVQPDPWATNPTSR